MAGSAGAPLRMLPAVRPEFVLFGDSITQQSFMRGGWGAQLTEQYQRTADITLRGYSGYNTRWALQLLPTVFPPARSAPALVTVFLGANDACRPAPLHLNGPESSRQHVPLEEYAANLLSIISVIRSCGDGTARVMLITPPPVDDAGWLSKLQNDYGQAKEADSNRLNEVTGKYARACIDVGRQAGAPVIDLWSDFQKQPKWQQMFSDGLHPNAAGGDFIFGRVSAAIGTHFPELQPASYGKEAPSLLPMDFPDHKSIDLADVAGCCRRHRQNGEQCAVHQPRQFPRGSAEADDDATGPCGGED